MGAYSGKNGSDTKAKDTGVVNVGWVVWIRWLDMEIWVSVWV